MFLFSQKVLLGSAGLGGMRRALSLCLLGLSYGLGVKHRKCGRKLVGGVQSCVDRRIP